jgi:hypothetical protein
MIKKLFCLIGLHDWSIESVEEIKNWVWGSMSPKLYVPTHYVTYRCSRCRKIMEEIK